MTSKIIQHHHHHHHSGSRLWRRGVSIPYSLITARQPLGGLCSLWRHVPDLACGAMHDAPAGRPSGLGGHPGHFLSQMAGNSLESHRAGTRMRRPASASMADERSDARAVRADCGSGSPAWGVGGQPSPSGVPGGQPAGAGSTCVQHGGERAGARGPTCSCWRPSYRQEKAAQ